MKINKLKRKFVLLFMVAFTVIILSGCGGGGGGGSSDDNNNDDPVDFVLSGDITSDMTLTADKVWELSGLVAVKSGAVLTIQPGTKIIGQSGTGANTSYLVIDKGSKI
ncbi:MAG: hypothetical protein WA081_21085, partial [Desulfosalsimonadaceae bacterium]